MHTILLTKILWISVQMIKLWTINSYYNDQTKWTINCTYIYIYIKKGPQRRLDISCKGYADPPPQGYVLKLKVCKKFYHIMSRFFSYRRPQSPKRCAKNSIFFKSGQICREYWNWSDNNFPNKWFFSVPFLVFEIWTISLFISL